MVSCFFALNRKGEYMQKSEKTVRGADVSEKTPVFKRNKGRTDYEVVLHFSSTSTENPYDKLKRIILNDCTNFEKFTK